VFDDLDALFKKFIAKEERQQQSDRPGSLEEQQHNVSPANSYTNSFNIMMLQ
jgi:hypothetical protein